MGAHQTHPVNIEQISSFGAWQYGDYTGYVEQSWIKWLGLCWTASYGWKEWRCQSERRGGEWCRGHMLASGALPCPLWRGMTVLGHSLLPWLSPPSSDLLGSGGGWSMKENRAAYWDNNVVYIGDSCKPSATALKPCRAMCVFSPACSNHEWANLPAKAKHMAFHAFKTLHLNCDLFWFALAQNTLFFFSSYFCS